MVECLLAGDLLAGGNLASAFAKVANSHLPIRWAGEHLEIRASHRRNSFDDAPVCSFRRFASLARGIYYTTPEEPRVMDSSGIASGEGAKAQLPGREYADDWIKKKPLPAREMSWFCTIFVFYEVGRHNDRYANIYTPIARQPSRKKSFRDITGLRFLNGGRMTQRSSKK